MNITELTLPEFAFVESSAHDGDKLFGRNVIIHTRSATVLEIFERDNVVAKKDILQLDFDNRNPLGELEHLTMLLHYSATLSPIEDRDLIKREIMQRAAKWYCEYCDYMDTKIIENE